MLHNALNHPASIPVHSKVLRTPLHGGHDESERVRRQLLDAGLHDEIAVLALDALLDVFGQLPHEPYLCVAREQLQHLLDHPAAVNVNGEARHGAPEPIREEQPPLSARHLQQRLQYRTPGLIASHVDSVRHDHLEQLWQLLLVGAADLLLQNCHARGAISASDVCATSLLDAGTLLGRRSGVCGRLAPGLRRPDRRRNARGLVY
mmetsp:Transcript_110958/g.312830  ORF Transcript_110958/g.312830 Transcript_110958/m.312830 type:complete len:205 (-) Transcript_110958:393-1007(-)